jgi:2,4-dienoyl-CoA reductase (NADPH2)
MLMTDKTRFQKLLEPGQIGKIRTKNRIIKACGGAEDIGRRNRAFLEAIARGGTGLVIWGDVAVEHPRGITIPITKRYLSDDTNMTAVSKIAEVIHKHDCPAFMQLFHAGPQAMLVGGLRTISSSGLTEEERIELMAPQPPKKMTISEIEDMVDKFADTAVRAHESGFDGVEVNAARMHLINSFLSRAWNKREDKYGCGSLENRSRFLVEIIREIKNRLGQAFPVITLINGIELRIDKGITVEEAKSFGVILQNAGVDALHIRAFGYHGFYDLDASPKGAYYSEDTKPLPKELDWSHRGKGALSPLSTAVKEVVSIPVITVGGLEDPIVAERILKEGKADFIGICKGLMADPEIANKVAQGRPEDIAFCPDCGDCARILFSMIESPEPIALRCRLNAALGTDQDYEIPPAQKKKRVVIAGGGPAGMEAARVAAIRGHEVILYEKENRLGGLLPWVAVIKGRDIEYDVMVLADFLKNQITKRGVHIILGEEFNPSIVQDTSPDVVILATGGTPSVPKIDGIDRSHVVSMDDLYRGMKHDLELIEPRVMREILRYWESVGKNVVIIGGTIEGSGLAEFLVERCRNVTLVDENTIWGDGLMASYSMRRVRRLPGVKYEEITDRGLTITTSEGKIQTIEADTIITAMSPGLNTELLKAVEGKAPEVHLIGLNDKEPSSIMNAIGNGYWIARGI